MIRRLRGLPLFWQTLILLFMSVAVAQAAGVLVLIISPPPRPDFNRMGDIVAALTGNAPARERRDHDDRGDRERELHVHREAAAPSPRPDMVSDPALVRALAERLHVSDASVRLWYEPDRPARAALGERRGRRSVFIKDGEPLFFAPIVVGVKSGDGWTVAETKLPPLIAPWQRRMALWFALSSILLLPLAWVFARALTRPISSLADAANRLGTDPTAPPVAEEEGPAELRVTAHALNRMQSRMADYVGERTAMIGAIAHDLRTPLARIAFRIEGAPEPTREKVLADVEQMRAMLAATIGFVRNLDTSGARVPVDLAALASALTDQEADLGRPVKAGETVRATVLGDPIALERLFQNLIDNGIAYGERVTVSVRPDQGMALVSVADEGPGMEEGLLQRAFQPFVRGDPSRNRDTGGIGLGLTIARTIAENHGGTLALANRKGGGLEALLRLPLVA
ncbi:HAMP domain-containing protein [Sphingomonas sp. AP4-R1]|uniref:ATP-binding protein n=1 Tax=Sphingomonas sp. AP4-R1 TaxID=2735134 RepID=UPI0014938582|nr:ATP-binding protein [Sphingomonas sp. AP4-R1]QJU58705.1 HAMP domain-containing protein [Sphingomonas sp. AP4-R1]